MNEQLLAAEVRSLRSEIAQHPESLPNEQNVNAQTEDIKSDVDQGRQLLDTISRRKAVDMLLSQSHSVSSECSWMSQLQQEVCGGSDDRLEVLRRWLAHIVTGSDISQLRPAGVELARYFTMFLKV